jgi:putative ABC transport system permease protein
MIMSITILLEMATRNLLRHTRRTLFLTCALGATTGLLVLLLGLIGGVRETMMQSATSLTSGHINVGGFFKATAGQVVPAVTEYPKVLEVVNSALPEMKSSYQRVRGGARLVSDFGSIRGMISGLDIKSEPKLRQVIQVSDGNFDDLAQRNTILIFESQNKKLKVNVGDMVTVSAETGRGVANTVDCRVVAIARDVGVLSQFSLFVPADTLRTLYQFRPDATGAIHIHLSPGDVSRVAELATRLRKALEQAGYQVMKPDPQAFFLKIGSLERENWIGQKLDVSTWEDEVSFMTWTLALLNSITAILMAFLIGIVITGLMNTMWVAIRERTREIGTLRAIGMQRRTVLLLFLFESLLLGAAGTTIGAAGGWCFAALLNALHIRVPMGGQLVLMSDHLQLALSLPTVAMASLTITLVTGLAALYPSRRAARLPPVAAMSHFG